MCFVSLYTYQDHHRARRQKSILHRTCGKSVAGASPTLRVADQNAALDQSQNVTQGRVLGTRGELRVFRCGQLSLKATELAQNGARRTLCPLRNSPLTCWKQIVSPSRKEHKENAFGHTPSSFPLSPVSRVPRF